MSKEEDKIAKILRNSNLPYKREVIFATLKSYGNKPLRFDFGIYNFDGSLKCLIEYDSIIHFKRVPYFHKNETEFRRAQERDRIKNKFCLLNRIPLIRIPYWGLDNLTINKIFNTPEWVVRNKYHNDYLRPPR